MVFQLCAANADEYMQMQQFQGTLCLALAGAVHACNLMPPCTQ